MSEVGPGLVPSSKEVEVKPAVLWRGFTVHPHKLSLAMFSQPLVPGTQAADDPTKVLDGNERGVYMSTNPKVAYVYAQGGEVLSQDREGEKGLKVKTQHSYMLRQGEMETAVKLPACGVVVKIDTSNVPIRQPQIKPALRGHYNNGFQGEEWIADEVPAESYTVTQLVLSRWANDGEGLVVNVDGTNPKALQAAINNVQEQFTRREQEARSFAAFVDSLSPAEAANLFILRKKWQQHLQAQAASELLAATKDT